MGTCRKTSCWTQYSVSKNVKIIPFVEIDVEYDGVSKPTGSLIAYSGDSPSRGDEVLFSFTIFNRGNSPLDLTGEPSIIIEDDYKPSSERFFVKTSPDKTSIGPDESTVFTISLIVPRDEEEETVEPLYQLKISIPNTDSDENPYILEVEVPIVSYRINNKSSNVWFFGDRVGITFDTTPFSIIEDNTTSQGEGSSLVSDGGGNFLFYTTGVSIITKDYSYMLWDTGQPSDIKNLRGHTSSSTSAIICNYPGQDGKYFVVTTPVSSEAASYSYIIDMKKNKGLGEISNEVELLNDLGQSFFSSERAALIQHSNGTDWWIILNNRSNNSPSYFVYPVTASGIGTPTRYAMPKPFRGFGAAIGFIKESFAGDFLAATNYTVGQDSAVYKMAFDNSTGAIDFNTIIKLHEFSSGTDTRYYGVEWSPNGQYIYASYTYNLTEYRIAMFDAITGTRLSGNFGSTLIINTNTPGSLQYAPDGRIYHSCSGYTKLAYIENPDLGPNGATYVSADVGVDVVSAAGIAEDREAIAGLPYFPKSYFNGGN